MKLQLILAISFVVLGLGLLAQPVQAQMMDGSMMEQTSETGGSNDSHGEALPAVLEEILQAHGWEQTSQVDCDQVSDGEWVGLGEAVMSNIHPNEEQHEAMDRMMGGEGSESLRQAHQYMGQNYLGCNTGEPWSGTMMGRGMSGIKGGGMMGMMMPWARNYNRPQEMMGFSSGFMGGWGVWAGLTWIVLIIFLVSGSYYFIKKSR